MKLDSLALNTLATRALKALNQYAVLWFLLLLIATYGFVVFQINNARLAQPSQNEVDSQTKSVASPHIDQTVVDQILHLQDHSVNVKTLFDEARSNPFHE